MLGRRIPSMARALKPLKGDDLLGDAASLATGRMKVMASWRLSLQTQRVRCEWV